MVGVPGQEAGRISVSDGALAYEEHGLPNAPAVVCVHGLTANRSTWRPVARRAGDLRLVLVDLLARGESDPSPTASYDISSEAARLAEFVATLGLAHPFLAGHSHGAAVVMGCADRVGARGLLLVNPVTPRLPRPRALDWLTLPGAPTVAAGFIRHFRVPLTRYTLVRRVFTGTSAVPAGAVARYAAPWTDRERVRCLVSILASWDPPQLAALTVRPEVPITLVAGARDRRIPLGLARDWSRELKAPLHVLADCGHAAPEEAPEAVARALRTLVGAAGDHAADNEERGEGDVR